MTTHTRRLTLASRGDGDVSDLTGEVEAAAKESGVGTGLACVFVPGSTAAVTTVEYEPGLVADLKEAFDRLVPEGSRYAHNRDGETNGHAHVRASIVGPSVAIPIVDGRLALGTWQQVVLVDFDDRPRSREVIVQVVGERP